MLLAMSLWAHQSQAQAPREVRQIVAFLFRPGMADSARAIYGRELRPAYLANAAMTQFRAYAEAESPEPLDMVVVSSFAGMAGMDASNVQLRGAESGGRRVFEWYGVLAGLSQHHHDQFVEMLPALGGSPVAAVDSSARLTVFEYVRVVPGGHRAWERMIGSEARARERAQGAVVRVEGGRMLVSDGWDYVRMFGIRSLADWQAHVEGARVSVYAARLGRLVVARKVVIVRQLPELAVR